MKRSALLWLIVGFAAFAVMPWYLVDGGSLSFGQFAGWPLGQSGSALALGLAGGKPWLLPLALAFAIAALPLLVGGRLIDSGKALVVAGIAGLIWFWLQGFAIDHKGWGLPGLVTIFGGTGPKQAGLGYGAFVVVMSLLLLLTHGLAARGWCRGDAFTTSAIGLILGLIILFVFFPVMKILAQAFQDASGNFAPREFFAKVFDTSIWGLGCITSGVRCGVAWNTLFLAVLVGVGTTALGLAFALIVTRTPFVGKGVLRLLTVLPIITPPFVIGLAVILLFGRTGMVTGLLDTLFDIPRSRWIYGLPGVFLAQMLAFTPIAFLVLIGVVQGISPSLEEATQTLRAKAWTTFHTVTLPLMRPGLANAFLLGFVESMADFGNPLVLGGNFEVLSTKIFFAVVGSANDPGRAAVLSIILLAFTLMAFWAQQRWVGRTNYTTVTGKGDAGLVVPLPQRVTWACYLTAVPWAILTVVIYVTILMGAFVKTMGRDYTPTLQHLLTAFRIEWGDRGMVLVGSAWDSLWVTLKVAAIAAPLTAIIGLLTAYLLTRQKFAGQRLFEFLALLSFAVPGTVVGVSYILAFNVPPVELTGTGLILIICFVFRNMPVGVRSGIATLAQIDKSLDEASFTLGARTGTTVRRIMLPLLRPAVVASLVYAFVRAMTAVSAVIFLVSAQYNMATAYIVGRVEAGEFGLAIAYSVVLIVIMLVAIALIQLLVGERKLGRRGAQEGSAGVAAVAGA
jgi:iron(III) transport system permease protein